MALDGQPCVAPLPRAELSVEDIAARSRQPLRTVKRWVARWHARGPVRVRRAQKPGDTRWRYWIDAEDYDAWKRGLFALPAAA